MERYFKPAPKPSDQENLQGLDSDNDDNTLENDPTLKTTCALLNTLRYRQVGLCMKGRYNTKKMLSSSYLLASRLKVKTLQTDNNNIGKSIAVFNSEGSLLAVGDSRPSITIYDFHQSELNLFSEESEQDHMIRLPSISPTVLLGTESFHSDRVTSICWSPFNDHKIAVSFEFHPDIKVFDIGPLLRGHCDADEFRSKHTSGHTSLLYAEDVNSSMHLIGGGSRGHIRCWKENQLNKPLWVVKRSDSAVKALGWVHQQADDIQPLSGTSKARKSSEVLNSKSGLLGLKRSRTLNGPLPVVQNNPQEHRKRVTHPQPLRDTCSKTRRVLVAVLSDGSISLWDMTNIKVRLMGSAPTPSLIATLHTRDLFQPLVRVPAGWQASVCRINTTSCKYQLMFTLTNGWCATFQLGTGDSLVATQKLRLGFPDNTGLVDYGGCMVHSRSHSGAKASLVIDPGLKDGVLYFLLRDSTRADQLKSVMHHCDAVSRLSIEPHPHLPIALVMIDHNISAVLTISTGK